ncbi:MAG: hypothetical protein JST27_08895, partial [Bacteroidetes bacterium]|nr:hypothetical protein [Bacteroidota bacterium]
MIQKIITLVLLALCAQGGFAQAQSWQWGRPISFDSSAKVYVYRPSNSTTGVVIGSTTDQTGNLYFLFNVGNGHLNIDGQTDTGFGKNDILLCSFNCDGFFRWSKLIGSSTDSDLALSVKASDEAGVYVMGIINMTTPGGAHFGTDTTIANTNKTMFLAKYDTAGNFQWVRLPQPDTISYSSAWNLSQPLDMDLGSDGTIYLLACLSPGAYVGGQYIVNSLSAHVLKYSSSGQFLGGVALPIYIASPTPTPFNYISSLNLCFDGTNNRFIITGSVSNRGLIIGNNTLNGTGISFSSSFNASSGNLVWLQASLPARQTPALTSFIRYISKPILDSRGNVYVAGLALDSAYFNGVLFRNPWHSQSNFVMKMDANTGQALWTTISRFGPNYSTSFNDLALTGNKLAITGTYQ